jgi:hypothetical protein
VKAEVEKSYSVFVAGKRVSRPFLPSLFISDPNEFERQWKEVTRRLNSKTANARTKAEKINAILYTAINAFAICYDLWKPSSRKTPGTFWEVMMGSVLGTLLPKHNRGKFVTIPGQEEKVPIDITFTNPATNQTLAFPAKITTRERIVQPAAHQRILDAVFGPGVLPQSKQEFAFVRVSGNTLAEEPS